MSGHVPGPVYGTALPNPQARSRQRFITPELNDTEVRMTKHLPARLLAIFLCLSLTGCVKMALTLSPSFIPRLSQTFFEECDTELARQSLPAGMKLLEGLLKNDPENTQILTSLCSAFTGYALLFVEGKDNQAASLLYLRARNYGLKALGIRIAAAPGTADSGFVEQIKTIGKQDLEALFWTTMAWNAWINLNLDKPTALGQVSAAKACLDRVLEVEPEYFWGVPYVLQGAMLSAVPTPLGGDSLKAMECFEKAMRLSKGRLFLVQYYYARTYAVSVQDKELFFKLIEEVENTPNDVLPEICLLNTVMKKKLEDLKQAADDLFL